MSSCILWQGEQDSKGYGVVKWRTFSGNLIYAHRQAYEDSKGSIPKGHEVMHLCHVPLCINPEHLKAVTHQENLAYDSYCGRLRSRNTSGIVGVNWRSDRGSWWAYYREFGVRYVLYYGKDFFEACCARKSWEAKKLLAYENPLIKLLTTE